MRTPKTTTTIAIIPQNTSGSFEIFLEAIVAPIPKPKINRAPTTNSNCFGFMVMLAILIGLLFMCYFYLLNSALISGLVSSIKVKTPNKIPRTPVKQFTTATAKI